jgi:glycerol uptake facilitator-like aquaporin
VASPIYERFVPQDKLEQAAGLEAIITFGLILMVLNLANRVQAQRTVRAAGRRRLHPGLGTTSGPYERRLDELRPKLRADVALGDLSTWWVYLVGSVAGTVIAVGVAHVLRGPVKAEEVEAAEGTPLDRGP